MRQRGGRGEVSSIYERGGGRLGQVRGDFETIFLSGQGEDPADKYHKLKSPKLDKHPKF